MMFELRTKHTLQIETTTVCALACPQCGRYYDGADNALMTTAELRLEDVQRLCPTDWVKHLKKMFLCGNHGEPVAAQDCMKILHWFKQTNPDIVLGVNTSGSLRNESWWADLGKLLNGPLDYVVFSIDGLEDTNHIYRRNSSWYKIIQNVKAFIAAGGSAQWDMLVFEHNKHQVDQAEQLARNLGFTWFRTKYTDRPITQNIRWLKKAADLPTTSVATQISCHYETTQQAYLSATGQWYPCCYIGGKIEYPDLAGDELRSIFSQQPQIFDEVHESEAWQTVSIRMPTTPLKVCAASCATIQGQPAALNKWRREVRLR